MLSYIAYMEPMGTGVPHLFPSFQLGSFGMSQPCLTGHFFSASLTVVYSPQKDGTNMVQDEFNTKHILKPKQVPFGELT